jgi:hypothetical protein
MGEWQRGGSAGVRVHLLTRAPLAVHAGLSGGETDVRDRAAPGNERFVRRLGGWAGVEAFWPGAAIHAALALPVEHVEVEGGTAGLAAGARLRAGTLPRLTHPVATGWRATAELRAGDVAYRSAELRAALPLAPGRWRAALVVEAGLAGGDVPLDTRLLLGADGRIPGLEWDEAPGKAMAVVGGDLAHPLAGLGWVRLRVRAGSARLGSCGVRACGRAGAQLGLFRATALGPVSAGLAVTDRGRVRFELGVGPSF